MQVATDNLFNMLRHPHDTQLQLASLLADLRIIQKLPAAQVISIHIDNSRIKSYSNRTSLISYLGYYDSYIYLKFTGFAHPSIIEAIIEHFKSKNYVVSCRDNSTYWDNQS